MKTIHAEQDINGALQQVVDRARTLLTAGSVVVFTRQDPAFIVSGELDNLQNERFAAFVKESRLADSIYENGAVYLETESQYREFISAQDTKREEASSEQDFWFPDNVKSSAFIRIGKEREPVGVMFINYRTPQIFDSFTQELIEALSLLIHFAILNHQLSVENSKFWERQRADSLSLSVSEIVASLAHNSGNLLNQISFRVGGFADRIRKSPSDKIDKRYVQDFLDEVQEPLNEVFKDFARLKDYRRLDHFPRQSCQIEELIDISLIMLRNKFEIRRITIRKQYARTPQVLCDKNAIQHVLLNLLLNAVDAVVRRGSIIIETDVKEDYVRIRISDNGSGIAPELRSKIFEPFFTTKKDEPGMGLGLAISRYIISNHGGNIEFTSKVGKGSTFSVYLPIVEI